VRQLHEFPDPLAKVKNQKKREGLLSISSEQIQLIVFFLGTSLLIRSLVERNFFFLKPDHVGLQIRSLASLNKKKHASRPRPSAESVWGRAHDRVPRRAEARRLSMVQR
jgi:hypothetical protein